MGWLAEFQTLFITTLVFFSLFFTGGWLSGANSRPWKYWTKNQILAGFLLAPALSSLLTGLAILFSLETESFSMERSFVGALFALTSLWLFTNYCGYFFEGASEALECGSICE